MFHRAITETHKPEVLYGLINSLGKPNIWKKIFQNSCLVHLKEFPVCATVTMNSKHQHDAIPTITVSHGLPRYLYKVGLAFPPDK